MSRFAEDAAITTERLNLAPLRVEDADEMTAVLADEQLHAFIGGRPATSAELRERYARLVAGSGDPGEVWLNWIVRRRADGRPVGTLQATLIDHEDRWTAYIAWVVGVEWQGQGFASEAARGLVAWLHQHGIYDIVAHIHPDHHASARVAANAGLQPTDELEDGERVWRVPGG